MKRCPTCNHTFDDETLTLCPDDSSALASESAAPPSEGGQSDLPGAQGYGGLGSKATWSASQDQVPGLQQYIAAQAKPRRRIWPWVVGVLALLFILIGLALVVILDRM